MPPWIVDRAAQVACPLADSAPNRERNHWVSMAHASARVPLRVHHACSLFQTGPYPDIRSSEAVLPKRPPRHHLSSSSRPDLYVVIVTDRPEPSRSRFFAGVSVARPGPAAEALYKIGVHNDVGQVSLPPSR